MDTKQSPTKLLLFFEGIKCLVVFPTHFNLNNSINFKATSNFSPNQVESLLKLLSTISFFFTSNYIWWHFAVKIGKSNFPYWPTVFLLKP